MKKVEIMSMYMGRNLNVARVMANAALFELMKLPYFMLLEFTLHEANGVEGYTLLIRYSFQEEVAL